jgi:hypothetical protein
MTSDMWHPYGLGHWTTIVLCHFMSDCDANLKGKNSRIYNQDRTRLKKNQVEKNLI